MDKKIIDYKMTFLSSEQASVCIRISRCHYNSLCISSCPDVDTEPRSLDASTV